MEKTRRMLLILLLMFSYAGAQKTDDSNHSFARLSYITGNTFVQNISDLSFEEGIVNRPVIEGDRVGTTDGRAEIFMRNGTYLRLDNNTKIDFLNIPKPGNNVVRIRLWTGSIYFTIGKLKEEKSIEINTSDVSFYILAKGLYRIDIRDNHETSISVFQGMIEAASETASVLIKKSQKMEIVQGQFTSRPKSFSLTPNDSFDRWSEYRDSQVKKRMANNYLLKKQNYNVKSYKPDNKISDFNIRRIKKKKGTRRFYSRNRSAINRFYSSITSISNNRDKRRSIFTRRKVLADPPVMRRPKSSSSSKSKEKKKKEKPETQSANVNVSKKSYLL